MKRHGSEGFTLLELLAVIAIIFTLAGLLMAGAGIARRTARRERSRATLNMLATACEDYWAACHDYPYPNPDVVGVPGDPWTLGAIPAFRTAYWHGSYWDDEGYNVALVYMLSQERSPHPWLDVQQKWYHKVEDDIAVPGGRTLYKVVDGWQNVIRVDRPSQYYYVNTYVKLISAGPDGDFSTKDDNLEVYIKR